MAIGIESQYNVLFSIGGLDDFIHARNLNSFVLVAECGNVLPVFELSFSCRDSDQIKYFNEGNVLTVSIGPGGDQEADESKLVIVDSKIARQGESSFSITLKGIYNALNYLMKNVTQISDKKSALEVMLDVVSPYFDPWFNNGVSEDSQYWIQGNIPDKSFVNQLWMRMDLTDKSFPVVGIDRDGRFVFKDIKMDLANDPAWTFTQTPAGGSDVMINSNITVSQSTGFMNQLYGYGKEQLINVIETGLSRTEESEASTMLAMTNVINKAAEVEKRQSVPGLIGENVHANYHKSYLHNLIFLTSFSQVEVTCSYVGIYRPIRLLDRVIFKDDSLENRKETMPYWSGEYYITKIAIAISDSKFTTNVTLNREAFDSQKKII